MYSEVSYWTNNAIFVSIAHFYGLLYLFKHDLAYQSPNLFFFLNPTYNKPSSLAEMRLFWERTEETRYGDS